MNQKYLPLIFENQTSFMISIRLKLNKCTVGVFNKCAKVAVPNPNDETDMIVDRKSDLIAIVFDVMFFKSILSVRMSLIRLVARNMAIDEIAPSKFTLVQ